MISRLPGAFKLLRGQYTVLVLYMQLLSTSASESREYIAQELKQNGWKESLVKNFAIFCINLYWNSLILFANVKKITAS